jgi:hypothetical protein
VSRARCSAAPLIGLVPDGDSTRRYLGRLRDGYTVDTAPSACSATIGRPSQHATRARDLKIQEMFSLNPVRITRPA